MSKKRRILIDGKEIKEEDVTEADLDRAKHLVHGSKGSIDEDISFGFSTMSNLEKWVGEQSKEEQKAYHWLLSQLEKSREKIKSAGEELDVIQQYQVSKTKTDTELLIKLLDLYGVDKNDGAKVAEAIRNLDPVYGFHSLLLAQYKNFGGRWLWLSSGGYPNLAWYDFDNRTTSFINDGCFWKFQYKYFDGNDHLLLYPKIQEDMEWWDNRLSSLVYGSYLTVVGYFL